MQPSARSGSDTSREAEVHRLVSLDVLRGAAVLLVLGRHLPPGLPSTGVPLLDTAFRAWNTGGWVGVDLFFVLSGFLVSGLLFREHERHGRFSVKRFLVRRALRLYPPFYAFLAVSVAAHALVGRPLATRDLLGELLYLQNYVGSMWGHTWSLAVEEHFYLLLPPLLLGLRDRRFAWFPAAFLTGAVACLVLRLLVPGPFGFGSHLNPTHLRLDSLLAGVFISYLHHVRPALLRPWLDRSRRPWLLALGGALLAPLFVLPLEETPFIAGPGLTVIWAAFGCILIAALGTRLTGRGWLALAWLGTHSYSIYLWHLPVRALTRLLSLRAPGIPTTLWFALYLATSVLVGVLFAKALELPLLALRDRLFPRPEGGLRAPAPSEETQTSGEAPEA